MFTLSQLCVRDTGHLLNAFQKAYSARLATGLPGRRCLWTSHWVSQPFTLWIKQSYSDVKLSVRICITVCFTHCVITSRWSAGTGKGSLTAEDVIYLFHGRSKKDVKRTANRWGSLSKQCVTPIWLYCEWKNEKVFEVFILSHITVRRFWKPFIVGWTHTSTAMFYSVQHLLSS